MTETVVAQITAIDDDDTATEEAAGLLLRELGQLDGVVSLRRKRSTAAVPVRARPGELVELGTLLAVLTAHGELVTSVLTTVGDWLRRRGRGRVEVTLGEHRLVLDSATAEEQHLLTIAFIDRVFPPDR
ncbi:effector-associated constant component EACC1 [Plantactinospora soyae]|uniref:Uncharacterized protein n=1 Tax=Plantactinospora soyae TaxID=1544732 RepID=A0A927RBD6_9ACTN|nr:hypothetical protein [Plantactinospora soyae]MBE1491581.1 hypothetical protein [Plantactinospora soyae]